MATIGGQIPAVQGRRTLLARRALRLLRTARTAVRPKLTWATRLRPPHLAART